MMKTRTVIRSMIALALSLFLLSSLCACNQSREHGIIPDAVKEGISVEESPPVTIRHFTLDAGLENVDLFFEIPYMAGGSIAADRISDFFLSLYMDFSEKEPGRVREILASAAPGTPSEDNTYRDCWTAQVQDCSDRWISISMSYDWYMGGVWDYGINGNTFDRGTGERLFLDDVLPGTEDEIQAAIACGLIEKYPEIGEIADAFGNTPLSTLRDLPVQEIDYYIIDGGIVTVIFDKNEIAPGAAGMFIVEMDERFSKRFSWV